MLLQPGKGQRKRVLRARQADAARGLRTDRSGGILRLPEKRQGLRQGQGCCPDTVPEMNQPAAAPYPIYPDHCGCNNNR